MNHSSTQLPISIIFLVFQFIACTPTRLVNIKDDIRNVNVYKFSTSKMKMSAIDKRYRTFHFSMQKEGPSNKDILLKVESSFLITENDYRDTAYITINNLNKAYAFLSIKNIQYQEKLDHISNTTDTKITVTTDSSVETKPTSGKDSKEISTTTTTDTKTTTSTSTNTDVRSQILDKTKSVRYIKLGDFVNNFSAVSQFKIRIYDNENDFWDLVFTNGDLNKLKIFFNSGL